MARNYYAEINLHFVWHDWQTGYGVVSFGTRDLQWVKDYVKNQRDHHARGRFVDRLERITAMDEGAEAEPREAP